LKLPVVPPAAASAPTLEAARKALGGPALGAEDAGLAVALADGRPGIVLHRGGGRVDVWVAAGRIHRVAPDRVDPLEEVPPGLAQVAEDARRFAALSAGDAVRFRTRDGGERSGTLVERCCFGGLVGVADGKVLAVGFRRVARVATR
jgi:hypothetical protein